MISPLSMTTARTRSWRRPMPMWGTGRRQTGMFAEDRAAFISALDDYSLLILDDLGVERNTGYAFEVL